MGMKKWLFLAVVVAGVAYFANNCCHKSEKLFTHPEATIWGKSKEDPSIKAFAIKFDKKDIDDLNLRLAQWRRHEPLDGVGVSYGLAGEYLDKLVKYWREKYDWFKMETRLNSLPQFTTVIQGLKVHFIHAKADERAKRRIPLLLVHGWPGSVVEFYRAIPFLTALGKDGSAFDVVAPSIPGYGFSEAAAKTGFNQIAAAQVFHTLMRRLGYQKFVYQGGDWGSIIGQLLSRIYPESVIGFHTNFPVPPTATVCAKLHLAAALIAPKLLLDERDQEALSRFKLNELFEETGYFHEQATKPDTLGVALSDSPVGLASWIIEKFVNYTEQAEFKGSPAGQGISNDDLLTNVMLYWLNNKATSAARFYKEMIQSVDKIEAWAKVPHSVPTGVTCYPRDVCSPKALMKHEMPRLVHYEHAERGGHFAAFEEPERFARDVRAAVNAFYQAREEEELERSKKLQAEKLAKEGSAEKHEEKPAAKEQDKPKQQQQTQTTKSPTTTPKPVTTTTVAPKQEQKTTTVAPKTTVTPKQEQKTTTVAPKTTVTPKQEQKTTTHAPKPTPAKEQPKQATTTTTTTKQPQVVTPPKQEQKPTTTVTTTPTAKTTTPKQEEKPKQATAKQPEQAGTNKPTQQQATTTAAPQQTKQGKK